MSRDPAILGFPPPPPGETRVILRNDDRNVPSTAQETDAHTALTKGLAEYAAQLTYDFGGGRLMQFQRVFDTWAEPENEADYPSAGVYATGEAEYDASKLDSGQPTREVVQGGFLLSSTEMVLDMMMDIWANDPTQRQGLVAMMEDALSPVDFRYGLLLELPFYFNQRASYELMKLRYVDDEDSAQRRIRRAQLTIRGRVPVTRFRSFAGMTVKLRTKVDGSE